MYGDKNIFSLEANRRLGGSINICDLSPNLLAQYLSTLTLQHKCSYENADFRISCVSFSQDGCLVVVGGKFQGRPAVQLMAQNLRKYIFLDDDPSVKGSVSSVTMSLDSRQIAAGIAGWDAGVVIIDINSNGEMKYNCQYSKHGDNLFVGFTSNDALIYAQSSSLFVHPFKIYALEMQEISNEYCITDVAFSLDGHRIVYAAGNDIVAMHEAFSWFQAWKLELNTNMGAVDLEPECTSVSLAFSSDGNNILCAIHDFNVMIIRFSNHVISHNIIPNTEHFEIVNVISAGSNSNLDLVFLKQDYTLMMVLVNMDSFDAITITHIDLTQYEPIDIIAKRIRGIINLVLVSKTKCSTLTLNEVTYDLSL